MTAILTRVPTPTPDPVRIPKWVKGLASFRRWARSDDFPEHGRISYLGGDIWVDLSMEREAHNQAKSEFTIVLGSLAKQADLGRFYSDGMRLTNTDAELSSEPDATFVSFDMIDAGRVRLTEGPDSLEVEGSPDMVLEIVSTSSVEKDTVVLRDLYWRAGVKEYWLVDPRGDDLQFDILRHGATGYAAARKQAGWLKSAVFGRSFRLTRQIDRTRLPAYSLASR